VITLHKPRTTNHEQQAGSRAVRWLESEHLVLVLTAVGFLVLWPITPGLATRENLANVLLTLLPLLVLACGQTVVLITGGIDLSACAIMAVASVVGGLAMNGDTGWLAGSPWAAPAGVLLMLGVGLVIGAFNGFAVATLRMPPFMVTLTGMMFFGGLAIWLTRSETIYNLPSAINALGGRLPLAAATAGGLALVVHLLLSRTMYGRWLYALGHNSRMARVSGVPVGAVTAGAYVLSGLLAAAAAVLYTGQAETASPFLGQRLLLDVIAATVIGGTSLFGGRGKVLWTVAGVLFIKLLDNSLNLLNCSFFTLTMVKGAAVLAAALLDATRRRWQEAGT
jgi:ribose/xylose/arabinose/galactoside ABC-type transport system permease subunit